MIKKYKWTILFTTLITLLPILIGLFLWDQLPEQVPIHWGINGEVDNWGSKSFAVFGLTGLMAACHLLCVFASSADPKSKNYHPRVFHMVLWICPLLSLLLNSMTYATALGYHVDVALIMPLLMGAMFIVIGNLMPKMRQSYTLGIKLPWTLNNEENWNKTHRFAGKVWVIGGVVLMATAIWGNFWFLLAALVIMVLTPTLYSYLLYQKQKEEE